MDPRVDIIKALAPNIPRNSLGLPNGIYRADLLPVPESVERLSQRHGKRKQQTPKLVASPRSASTNIATVAPIVASRVHGSAPTLELKPEPELDILHTRPGFGVPHKYLVHAYIPILYDEGFPTLSDGQPIWGPIDFEPPEVYQVFRTYLAQAASGARQLHELADEYTGPLPVTMEQVREYFFLYYWDDRARAWDLFRNVVARKKREERALSLEEDHYQMASDLIAKVKEQIKDDPEFFEGMKPKDAVDILKTLIQVQRSAIGLSANGEKPVEGGGEAFSVAFRQYGQRNNGIEEGKLARDIALDDVLNDVEATELAQELIITVGRNKAA